MHAMSDLVLAIRARIYRDGLVQALAARPDITVVAAAGDTESALTAVQRCAPDLLLADTTLAGALALATRARALGAGTRVVALAVDTGDDGTLLQWAEAGAVGFVTCDNTLDELVHCVDAALGGELACSPRVSATLLRRLTELAAERAPVHALPPLTPRQQHILQFLQTGLSNKQIARELGIEIDTVKNDVHHLLRRLQVRDRHDAVAAIAALAAMPRRSDSAR